jgi:hypothetical protein
LLRDERRGAEGDDHTDPKAFHVHTYTEGESAGQPEALSRKKCLKTWLPLYDNDAHRVQLLTSVLRNGTRMTNAIPLKELRRHNGSVCAK